MESLLTPEICFSTKPFLGHLFSAMQKAGLRVFLDKKGLDQGRDIQPNLHEAIRNSEMSVVILSPGYADTRWCLDELVEIMELHESKAHSVLPVFFDVKPTVVRNQTGAYEDAFKKQEKRFEDEMYRVQKWRWALKQVGRLTGLSLDADRNEALLVESIIQEVRKLVRATPLYVPPNIVGRDGVVTDINMWVQDGSSDVEAGMIYGLAGIGKSTIARLVFNHNAEKFDGSSFLTDITRKINKDDDLTCFLEQVILDVTGKSGNKIYNVEQGLMAVRAIVCWRRVLIVLDDVDELEHLPDAFYDSGFFGKGSKIIITTKNQELRKLPIVKQKFEVVRLVYEKSMELLKSHAFDNKDPPSPCQEELLKRFLRHCHGLPLAHTLMGRRLRCETHQMWEDLLKEMDKHPNNDVIRASYDAIGDTDAKEVFLYLACFFIGGLKKHVVILLESCGFRAVSGIQKLIDRCLVIVDNAGTLTMHQSIEEMGLQIVDQEPIDKRRLLWNSKDALYLLQSNKGASSIRGLILNYQFINRDTSHPYAHITTSAFTNMPDLDMLRLCMVKLDRKSFEDFPKRMKWLFWRGFPLESIPSDLKLDELMVLSMRNSSLVHAWKGSKELWELRYLCLDHSYQLKTTPNLSCSPLLEHVSFKGCINLVEVHESFGNLKRLVTLNFKDCRSLVLFHVSFEKLKNLVGLYFHGCTSLTKLPFTRLPSLELFNLTKCRRLFNISNEMESSVICKSRSSTMGPYEPSVTQYQVPCTSPCCVFKLILPALKKLYLAKCGISRTDIFDWIKNSPSIEVLGLSYNPICVLNMLDMDGCKRLKVIVCSNLESISNIPWCCKVAADSCISLERISYTRSTAMTQNTPGLYGGGFGKLAEVDVGLGNVLRIEREGEMNDDQAMYLGFPTMNTFERRSWGKYICGTYRVCLDGLHLSKWFTTILTYKTEISYTVPSSSCLPGEQPGILALNLGVSGTINGDVILHDNDGTQVSRIDNLSRWQWPFRLGEPIRSSSEGRGVTWLIHFSVMEHREIRPGDKLKISVLTPGVTPSEIGIKIMYEEGQKDGEIQESWSTNQIINNTRGRGGRLNYSKLTVPSSSSSSPHPPSNIIRALDFGYVRTSTGISRLNTTNPQLSRRRVWEVTIEAETGGRRRIWRLKVPYRPSGNANGEVMTMAWLSNWCEMERREIQHGDLLKISVCDPTRPLLKLGIKIIYEDQKHMEETKQDSCSSRSNSQIKFDEEAATVVRIVAWDSNTHLSPFLDPSLFKEIGEDANFVVENNPHDSFYNKLFGYVNWSSIREKMKIIFKLGAEDKEEEVVSSAVIVQARRDVNGREWPTYYEYNVLFSSVCDDQPSVRAFDFGFVHTSSRFSRLSIESLPYQVRIVIKNQRRDGSLNWMLEELHQPNINSVVVTMRLLRQWCYMKSLEIYNGDLLKISVFDPTLQRPKKLGIKIIYEDRKGREEAPQESCSRSNSQVEVGEEGGEEEADSAFDVATWYNNALHPPHLDISLFLKTDTHKDATDDERQ